MSRLALGIRRGQGNDENTRIEVINELMLQAKVPENLGQLEVVPEALALTKSLCHLIRSASRPPNASKCLTAMTCRTAMAPLTPFMTV